MSDPLDDEADAAFQRFVRWQIGGRRPGAPRWVRVSLLLTLCAAVMASAVAGHPWWLTYSWLALACAASWWCNEAPTG